MGKLSFVHAGVDLTKKDWRKTSLRDFIWIREPFHEGKTIQVRQLYLDIRLHQCSMEICRQQTSGFRIIKSEWTVGLYSRVIAWGCFDKEGILQDIEYQNNEGPWHGI